MPRLSPRFLLLFLVTAVLGGGLVGCDSGGGGDDLEASSATVQFASAGKSATPSDSLVSVPITLQNPQGSEVSVEVLFAAQASSAPDSAIGGGETKSVTFPSSAESGATQSVTFDVSKADLSGGPLDAYFALQNAQSEAPVEIGETDEFAINIGATPVAEARQKPTGTTVTIEGTITRSDDIGFYFQDGSGAALYVVHFGEGPLGSAVTSGDLGVGTQLRLTGSTGEYEGLYQLQDVGGSYTVLAQEAELPAPQEIALADVGEEYEAELVSVAGLTVDASGSFQAGTGYTLSSASGESITMFVPDGSGLVGQTIPDGETTYTGVVDVFRGSFQFLGLRAGDIGEADDGGGGDAQVILAEDFQDGADLGAFSQYSVSSDSNWVHRSFEENGYAYINQFDADEAANDWLITDEVLALDDFENEVLTFANVKRYGSEDTDLRLKYSTDYDGEGDPTSATWTDISGRVTWDDASGDYTFQTAGPVDLSDLPGSVYLAFHYTEADDALWQLDDILIEEEGASDGGFPEPPGRPNN